MHVTAISFLLILMLFSPFLQAQRRCDAIYFNGVIHVLDSAGTMVSAFAVSKGRVLAVGSDQDILTQYRSSRTTDLKKRHVFPGFIDAHAHLYGIGEKKLILPLGEAAGKAAILAMVADAARNAEPGNWIRGRGWDQNKWPDRRFPEKGELDAISMRHPIMLVRVDGHAAWVNSRALEIAGITITTPDPPGGKILRNVDGSPTGILLDEAVELVKTRIPAPTPAQREAVYAAAIAACASLGITGMHDMGIHREHIDAIRRLIGKGAFPFRLTAYIDGRGDDWENLLKTGRKTYGDDQLTLNGLKLYADGALGSRGALLLEDYSDDAGNRGIAILPRDSIAYESIRAMRRGLQVCVHAIGDSANRLTLDAYEEALRSVEGPHLPPRIEHAQVLSKQDIPRFTALGVIPSMQPVHCTSDMYWAEARLGGNRIRGAYAWHSLLSHGSHIAGGSDAPVENPDPIIGMYAARARKDNAGRPMTIGDISAFFQLDSASEPNPMRYSNGWYSSEAVGPADALRMFTRWAAEASGQQALFGSLETGKYADFVILSDDILKVRDPRVQTVKVEETYVGGIRVYPAQE